MEIKFRAFNKREKKWVDWDKMQGLFELNGSTEPDGPQDFIISTRDPDPNNIDIVQYIGHQDQNGQDVYKGDIVELETIDPYGDIDLSVPYEDVPKIKARGIVTTGWCGWMVEQIFPKDDSYRCQNCFYDPEGSCFNWQELEVVGNIYEDM